MKKTFRIILMTLMMIISASAFAASKKSIVCTTYPEYDWVLNVLGSRASAFNVTLLQNKGTDLHSYQPSVQDIAKISVSDLFVYPGLPAGLPDHLSVDGDGEGRRKADARDGAQDRRHLRSLERTDVRRAADGADSF